MPADELFWPIPRNIMQLVDADANQIHRLRSLVTYQFLFGGKLVIRDSDYLNFLTLRSAFLAGTGGRVTGDADFFRSAFMEKWLLISCRNEKSIGETAEGLLGRGGSSRIPIELYHNSALDIQAISKLELIERRLQFSLSNASLYYTEQITKILNTTLGPDLPDHFREQLADRVRAKINESGTVGWEFLSLEGGVWEGLEESAKHQYGDFIFRVVGQAPHAGFIPDTLGTDPIYMNDVAKSINLWRGRKSTERESIEKYTFNLGAGFSLSDYVECLSCLSIDVVQALVSSEEGIEFRKVSKGFAQQKQTLKELEMAYRGYRKRIDERILSFISYRKSGSEVTLGAFKSEFLEEGKTEAINIVIDEVVGNAVPFWKLGYSAYMWLCHGEWPRQRIGRMAVEESSNLAATLIHNIQEHPDRITSEIVADSDGRIDRPVEMDWGIKQDVCIEDAVA